MTSFHKPKERGLLDTWRSEAFNQGMHFAKCEAARVAYEILRGRPDARFVEEAIMRIEAPRDEDE